MQRYILLRPLGMGAVLHLASPYSPDRAKCQVGRDIYKIVFFNRLPFGVRVCRACTGEGRKMRADRTDTVHKLKSQVSKLRSKLDMLNDDLKRLQHYCDQISWFHSRRVEKMSDDEFAELIQKLYDTRAFLFGKGIRIAR